MLTIIIIILLFASLVLTHEWGHYIVARRGGIDADEFGLGFPPKLFGKQIGKTLYTINLLPLGGFVRLKGEDAADTSEGSFGAAKFWTQTKVLFAGVGVNFLSAVLLLFILCLTGIPGLGSQFEPSFIHSTYAQPKQLLITDVTPGSPAAQAGLKEDDHIISGNGVALATDDQLFDFTLAHAGETVNLVVVRGGHQTTITPKLLPRLATDVYLGVETKAIPAGQLEITDVAAGSPAAKLVLVAGDVITDVDGQTFTSDNAFRKYTDQQAGETVKLTVIESGQTKHLSTKLLDAGATKGYLGVGVEQVYKLRYSPLNALAAAVYITATLVWATLVGIFSLIISIPLLVVDLFHKGVPQQAQQTGGPIFIVYLLKNISKLGWSYVILIMANVAVALGTFNALPLPALDGGRWFVLATQKLTGRKWSADAEARYHGSGFIALIALMVLISIYDIRKIPW